MSYDPTQRMDWLRLTLEQKHAIDALCPVADNLQALADLVSSWSDDECIAGMGYIIRLDYKAALSGNTAKPRTPIDVLVRKHAKRCMELAR